MEDYEIYINNVKTIRNLSKVIIDDSDDKKAIINKIQDNAKKAFDLKTWNDNYLNDFLYSKNVEDLKEDDIYKLNELVNETFDYTNSLDAGVSFKIYQKLLEYAKYKNNDKEYIKYLYNSGISLYYLSSREIHGGGTLFANRISEYFTKGASYLDRFEEFDTETRAYIIRCLGNSKIGLERRTYKGVKKYYELSDYALSIITSPKYHQIDPNVNWNNFEYGMKMDQLTVLAYLRENDDKEIANKVLEAATYVYNKQLNEDNTKYLNWRINYYYHAALYHAGKISLNELVNKLKGIVDNAKSDDTSLQGIYENLSAKAYLIYYANLLDKEDREKISDDLQRYIKDAYKYLDSLPGEYYRYSVTSGIRELVDIQAEVSEDEKTSMMNYLVAFHKPTYVHSLMVAKICEALTACVLMKCPERLIGVLDTTTKEEVLNKNDEMLRLAYNCGIYHDIGKNMCMSYININERKLIDEEFENIKTHTSSGYQILMKNKNNELYALAALYHHRFYNGEGGYPTLDKCPSNIKPIVDILSVADSIDAATDSIGRHYKITKTLDDLIVEFEKLSGTRYAPYVIDLFKDDTVKKYINNIVVNERLLVYLNVYHKGKSFTISSFNKN